MALSDEVQSRVADQLLVELTRRDDRTATTIDTTLIDLAAADAEGEFRTLVGVAFDFTNAQHLPAGISGTLYHLHSYAGRPAKTTEDRRQRFLNQCRDLARTIGTKQRVSPQTSSTLTPSTERSGRRPDQDRTRWRDVAPRLPRGSSQQEA